MTAVRAQRAGTRGGHTLRAVDSHTCGQPTRVLIDGLPNLKYATLGEAREQFRAEHDWIRRCAVLEPHGHRSLFAAALVPAADEACATGVVFMDATGYHDMCGHATIGVVTTLVEQGFVKVADGDRKIAIDTPAGRIDTRVRVVHGKAASVTFVNQPAFFLESVTIPTSVGEHEVGIAYGGQWYAFVDAESFGLRIEPDAIDRLVSRAAEIRPAVAEAVTGADPRTGARAEIENVMWTDRPATGADGRNMPVNAAGGFDRSPCGTGTSARLALLHAIGALRPGETYVNAGVLGTTYTGRIAEVTKVGMHTAVVPEITGSAWVTGSSELWVDPDDPLGEGFLI
jgi:proline racemase